MYTFARAIHLMYQYSRNVLFYYPFVKKFEGKFLVLNPIYFTPKYFVFGKNVFVRDHARLEGVDEYMKDRFSPLIFFGHNVSIEQNFHLTCAGRIEIGSNTAIAANVTVTDINHPYEDPSISPEFQNIQIKEVLIGEDCKIYNNAVILPGTRLGKHCIVGANTVVTGKAYPAYSVIVGSPSRIIKRYNFETNLWTKTNEIGDFIN